MRRKKLKLINFWSIAFISLVLISLCFLFILIQFDKEVWPFAVDTGKRYATTKINSAIDNSVERVISEMGVKTDDFFVKNFNSDENLNYLNINSMLINNVCSKVAREVSDELNQYTEEKVYLPIGMLLGINLLSNVGPKCSVNLDPMGDATVDYETAFNAVGINQVNFQIWLEIESEIRISNILKTADVVVKRKLMLVNTVFNGDVPSTYFEFLK